ncbi:alpha/beta fold hydrolase [Streptomyces sp. NPDC059637]|uniref:alpha/beta fold hydrolase n=1 Tax=Streptomyces sp. NPDC059637 TaxID=3347752 RepID=UPI00368DB396
MTDDAARAAAVAGGAAGRRSRAGGLGPVVGVAAAGAAVGVALERMTVGRSVRRRARLALDTAGPFGTLRGTPVTVTAEDGTELYCETEPGPAQRERPRRRYRDGWWRTGPLRPRRRAAPAPLTVVFCHGYCLTQDSWHFQRAALRGRVRAVYWDQRSHGRSGRGRAGAAGEPAGIDRLGRDLKAVLDALVPEGPVVLAGHSMGGMTVMAFADQYPQYVRERVAGVMLVGTSAGRLGTVTLGLPAVGARALHRVVPGLLRALSTQVDLVERGRRATADLFATVVKRYAFGSYVDPVVARFAERMLESTPIDVVAEFFPAFTQHEKAEALAALEGVPTLVLAGDGDLLTPADHSAAIAEALPGAVLVVVEDAGHLVMMEHPGTVNREMAALLVRAAERAGAPLPDAVRESALGPEGGPARRPTGGPPSGAA